MAASRCTAWETEAPSQAHDLRAISQVGSPYVGPFKDDVQMVRTQLLVGSADGAGTGALSLGTANGDPATEGTFTLRLRRLGSSCKRALGLGDAVLMRVRLDFRAGRPPPPSRIAGKSLSGRLLAYWTPFRHPIAAAAAWRDSRAPTAAA